ncbi:MAG: VanZ family protein [Planctomycetota bacterium]
MAARRPDGIDGGVGALRRLGRAAASVPRALAWIPPVTLAVFIFSLSSREGGSGPRSWWHLGGLTWNLAHPVLYGVLALSAIPLAPRATAAGERRAIALTPTAALWLFVLVVLYGFTDELHQSTVDGRDASLLDVVSDGVGAAAVLSIAVYLGGNSASDGGLVRRIVAWAIAALAAAGAATLWGRFVGPGPWPF